MNLNLKIRPFEEITTKTIQKQIIWIKIEVLIFKTIFIFFSS